MSWIWSIIIFFHLIFILINCIKFWFCCCCEILSAHFISLRHYDLIVLLTHYSSSIQRTSYFLKLFFKLLNLIHFLFFIPYSSVVWKFFLICLIGKVWRWFRRWYFFIQKMFIIRSSGWTNRCWVSTYS